MQSTAIVQLESVPVDQPESNQHQQQQPEEAVESVDQPVQEAREQSTTNGQQEPGGQQPEEHSVTLNLRTVTKVQVRWKDEVGEPLIDVKSYLLDSEELPVKKRPVLKRIIRRSNMKRRLGSASAARRFKSGGPKRSHAARLPKLEW